MVPQEGLPGKEGRRRRADERRLVELWAIVEAWESTPSRQVYVLGTLSAAFVPGRPLVTETATGEPTPHPTRQA